MSVTVALIGWLFIIGLTLFWLWDKINILWYRMQSKQERKKK